LTLSPAYKTITRNRCVGAGLCPSRSIYGNPIDRSFVGADDSVRPVRNGTIIVRAGRVARPYNRLPYPVCLPCGAMHPKGTCSASLHCVGIAPYEMQSKLQTRGGFFLLSVVG
jgi:hypothetical protein